MGQSMKVVCAVVRPLKLDQILESLAGLGIRSLTVTETKGYGQRGYTELYRGAEFTPKFRPMTKIEVAVATHDVEKVIMAIRRAAKTDQAGDGKIFVSQLEHVLSIRTGATEGAVPPLAA